MGDGETRLSDGSGVREGLRGVGEVQNVVLG